MDSSADKKGLPLVPPQIETDDVDDDELELDDDELELDDDDDEDVTEAEAERADGA